MFKQKIYEIKYYIIPGVNKTILISAINESFALRKLYKKICAAQAVSIKKYE